MALHNMMATLINRILLFVKINFILKMSMIMVLCLKLNLFYICANKIKNSL